MDLMDIRRLISAMPINHLSEINQRAVLILAEQFASLATDRERNGLALARHIIAMADDAYLVGHPEWNAIVEEAKGLTTANKEVEHEEADHQTGH